MKQLPAIANATLATIGAFLGTYWLPILAVVGIIATFVVLVIVRDGQDTNEKMLEQAQEDEKNRLEDEQKEIQEEKEKKLDEAKKEFEEDLENPPDDLGNALDGEIQELKDRYGQ